MRRSNKVCIVLSEIPVCFLKTKDTTAPYMVSTDPETDLRSDLSAAKSASLQLSILMDSVELLVLLMNSFSVFVSYRYLATRFAIFQSLITGLCVCRVARCTAKQIFGRVQRVIQSKLPTSDWKALTLATPALEVDINNSDPGSLFSLYSSPIGNRTPLAVPSPCSFNSKSMVTP